MQPGGKDSYSIIRGTQISISRRGFVLIRSMMNQDTAVIFAYGQSKLANILHANELARRLKEKGVDITVNSLHPGSIITNILRHHGYVNAVANMVGKYFLKNVQQGAATQCYVALHPQVKGISGEYFMDSNTASPTNLAKDSELAKKLWEFSLSLTNPK
uniref:Short-chain dehydrogenase TIC 32, chloroplastic n=1 Tax=Lotus japonicus TaxID=34305 RepID=I3SM28_LOTJA|nr:unknown [Lotus japonicus]